MMKFGLTLRREGFCHQLLSLDKDTKTNSWGNKIKGWWRKGDIKVTKYKKIFECWVKSPANVPKETQDTIKTTMRAPQQNFGKVNYTTSMEHSQLETG